MENGCPSLADQLATSQQRVRELEQTDAEQKAVIVQQQEAIAAYQEQLAKAAEQLRFLKRAMFGQRRERYAPPPDQKVLFVPEVVEGLDAKQETTQDSNADSPAASGSTKATTTKDRVTAILGTSADQLSATGLGIALRLLRDATDYYPYHRHEAGGDGRGRVL